MGYGPHRSIRAALRLAVTAGPRDRPEAVRRAGSVRQLEVSPGDQPQHLRLPQHPRRRRPRLRDLPPRRRPRPGAPALQPQGAGREPAAHRGRRQHHRRPRARPGRLGPGRRARHGDPVHPGPRRHAGLHRRALHRRPGHHARGGRRPRRRPRGHQPPQPRRDGHRPFRADRLLRPTRIPGAQQGARVRAQLRALPVPALGTGSAVQLPRGPPGHRHRPPGQHRVPGPHRLHPRGRRRHPGLSRHLRGHRLPHHHGQRPGRPGLGRGRHRGRGRHAGPARLHAHPQGGGLQALRRHPRRRHRHRRGPDHHRDAARPRRGGQVRRVLRRGRRRGAAGQPRHHRQHEPRVRLHRRDLPDRRGHPGLPAPDRPLRGARAPGGGLHQGTGNVARPGPRARLLRVPRAGPVHRGALHRRPQAPPGPHRPVTGQGVLPGGPAHLRLPALQADVGDPGRRHRHRAGPRARRHRLDHLVHQHLQPLGDDGRRPAGPQRRRPGPALQALGEDLHRPGQPGRHRLLREGRVVARPQRAGIQRRRLRLRHLHRQLRAPAGRGLPGGQRRRPRRGLGAVGQPQLRGAHQPRRQDELPGLPAPGHRLRPGRDHGHRLRHRAAGPGSRGPRRLPVRHLARPHGGPGRHRRHHRPRDVHARLRRRLRR